MKVTRELRKQINAAVRQHGLGANAAEVGLRGNMNSGPNALLWTDDDDLDDLVRVADLREVQEDPAHPGVAVLDLYAYLRTQHDSELITNVYVAIRDGHVVAAHHTARAFDRQLAALVPAFPLGSGWLAPADGVTPRAVTGRFGVRQMFE